MRIVQIIHSLNPGGAERLVVDLSNELSKGDGNEIILISLKNRKDKNEEFYLHELLPKIDYIPMNFGDGFNIFYLLRLSKVIRLCNPNIVHVHSQIHYIVLAFFLNWNTRFVYTLHNRADILLNGIRKYIIKLFSKFTRFKTITISDENQKSLYEYCKVKNDIIVYNGRQMPEKSKDFAITADFINKLKKHSDDIILMAIAKCSVQKNLQLLIKSVNTLVLEGKHISLIIIGDNYFNSELGRELRDMAGETIHFVGTKSNIGDFLFLSDAFCLSSIFEGMPITLLEAFACGCIPISTPVSGAIDIIENGVTGFLTTGFTDGEYTDTLRYFLEVRETLDKDKLKVKFNESFSINKCAIQYYNLYKELLN